MNYSLREVDPHLGMGVSHDAASNEAAENLCARRGSSPNVTAVLAY